MAFNSANLSKWSRSNEPGPQLFGYVTEQDTVATVSQSDYFTPFGDSYLQSLFQFPFNVGDTIQCTCFDGNINLTVTSIAPVATTEETQSIIVGPNSVNTAAIQNQAVTAPKIANGTISTTQISNTAGITGTQIASNTISAGNIVNNTITTTQISNSAGITGTQLAANTIVAGNIANGTITTTQISNSAGITGTQLASKTVAAGNITDGTITTSQISNSAAITGTQLAANTIVAGNIADGAISNTQVNASAAIDYSKLATLSSGNILVGNASNKAAGVAMTGTVAISNSGVTSIPLATATALIGDITTGNAVPLTFTSAGHILISRNGFGFLYLDQLAMSGAITMDTDGITSLGSLVVNTGNIISNAVTTAKIAANAVDTTKLALTTIQFATVTSINPKTLFSAGTQLVAAPGAGKLIIPIQFSFNYVFSSAQMTSGGNIAVQYKSTVNQGGQVCSGVLAAATLNAFSANAAFSLTNAVNGVTSNSINQPLYLTCATQNFATGSGTITAFVSYIVVSAS